MRIQQNKGNTGEYREYRRILGIQENTCREYRVFCIDNFQIGSAMSAFIGYKQTSKEGSQISNYILILPSQRFPKN